MTTRPVPTVDGVQKAVAAAVVSIASLVGIFVTFDPNVTQTILAIVAGAGNVAAVYGFRNKPAGVA